MNKTELASPSAASVADVSWWSAVLLCGMAGGMGWGIRGQYGHESGAMMAGLLVSSVIATLFLSHVSGHAAARAIAWCTIAIGFGGSQTYGQTIGLTQNSWLIGNDTAWYWGMLGLAIKGGNWIGFAGCFLGMALGGQRYSRREILFVMLALPLLYFIGVWLLNSPFDPANRQLPKFYFSETWDWKTEGEVKPRFECWGGLMVALAGLCVYTGFVRGDRLARRFALFGVIGGVIGFPAGQCLQSFHAWYPELYKSGIWTSLDPHMNWWNMMEITFGTIMGASLGLCAWLNRALLKSDSGTEPVVSARIDLLLLVVHLTLLTLSEFENVPVIDPIYGLGLGMAIIPMVASTSSRWWPFLLSMPVIMLPIAGKTVRKMVYQEPAVGAIAGWLIYLVVPMMVASVVAVLLKRAADRGSDGSAIGRGLLVTSAISFFALNFAFFSFPWPWQTWTGRTPSAIIDIVCLIALVATGLRRRPVNVAQNPSAGRGS